MQNENAVAHLSENYSHDNSNPVDVIFIPKYSCTLNLVIILLERTLI